MKSRLFNNNKKLPIDVVPQYILPRLYINDFLHFTSSSKAMRGFFDEYLKTGNGEDTFILKNKILLFWFFNSHVLQGNEAFYVNQLQYFIQRGKLDFWQKILAYHLLASIKENQQGNFLQVLEGCDPEILDSLVEMRTLLMQAKDSKETGSLLSSIETLFFSKERPEYIKLSLARCFATLVKVKSISSIQLDAIIELGIEYLKNSDHSHHASSAAILLNHLSLIQPNASQEIRISNLLMKKLNHNQDCLVSRMKLLQLLKDFVGTIQLTKKNMMNTIYENICAELSSGLYGSIDLIKYLLPYLNESQLINLKNILIENIKSNNDQNVIPQINDALVFVSGKIGNHFLNDIFALIYRDEVVSGSQQEYFLAKILVECIYINHFFYHDLIETCLSFLEDKNTFKNIFSIHLLSIFKHELSEEQIQVVLTYLLNSSKDNSTNSISVIEALQKFASCPISKGWHFKIVSYLMLFVGVDDLLHEQVFFALSEYARFLNEDQSLQIANLLFTKLHQSNEVQSFSLTVACMNVLDKFFKYLSTDKKLKVVNFFENLLNHEDFEIVLTAIKGLERIEKFLSYHQILRIVDQLLILENTINNDELSVCCFKTVNLFLSRLPHEEILRILNFCYDNLKKRNTEPLLDFIEENTRLLQKRDEILYSKWISIISQIDKPKQYKNFF